MTTTFLVVGFIGMPFAFAPLSSREPERRQQLARKDGADAARIPR